MIKQQGRIQLYTIKINCYMRVQCRSGIDPQIVCLALKFGKIKSLMLNFRKRKCVNPQPPKPKDEPAKRAEKGFVFCLLLYNTEFVLYSFLTILRFRFNKVACHIHAHCRFATGRKEE